MAVEYKKAPSVVIKLVENVIGLHHDDLDGARIGVIMREKAATSRGRRVMGEAKKVSAQQQVFIPLDFILCFAEDVWGELTPEQREALVDHELCHCTMTENEQYRMVPHDIEIFKANFERYGFWWPFAESTEELFQARLGLPEAVKQAATVVAMEPTKDVDEQVRDLFDEAGDNDTAG